MWEFLSLVLVLGGSALAAPHAIPAYKAYIRQAREDAEKERELSEQRRMSLPEDARRQEELKELAHRRLIASEKVKTLAAEIQCEAAEAAADYAREHGILAEMGAKAIALPAPKSGSTTSTETQASAGAAGYHQPDVTVEPPSATIKMPTIRTVRGR